MAFKPLLEPGLLPLALGVEEAGQHDAVVHHHGGIGREHQVGQARLGFELLHLGMAGQHRLQLLPLGRGHRLGGAVHVALHPGVDDVIDVVVAGGAHQESGFAHRRLRCKVA